MSYRSVEYRLTNTPMINSGNRGVQSLQIVPKTLVLYIMMFTCSIFSTAHAQGVPGWVSYSEEVPFTDTSFDSNAGIVNVVAQGVPNDGTDAACPLMNLLSQYITQYGPAYSGQDKIIFFPNGTYTLSDPNCIPIVKNYGVGGPPAYGMVLLGESQSGVVLRLAPASPIVPVNFTGDTAAASGTVSNVSSTAGLYFGQFVYGSGIRPGTTIASVGSGTITLSQHAAATGTHVSLSTLTPVIMTQSAGTDGLEGFHNIIENLTIDVSVGGNYGATALAYLGNNVGAVRNVTIIGPSGSSALGTGIDMTLPKVGPALIENVKITGFKKGIDVANLEAGVTLEHISFINQYSGALFNADNLVTANQIDVNSVYPSSVAVTNSTSSGYVILNNSLFDQTQAGLISDTNGAISFSNTRFVAAQSNLGGSSGIVNGKLVGSTWTPGSGLMFAPTDDTPVPPYDPQAQWQGASGASAWWLNTDGTITGTPTDALSHINAALACHGTNVTMYLPHGIYYISAPITIPSYVDRIVGMDSTIRILPGSNANFPAGAPIFDVVSNSSGSCPYSNTLVIERLGFDGSPAGSPFGIFAVRADAPTLGYFPRTVVMRDVGAGGIYRLSQARNAGLMYLENTAGSAMTVAGPQPVEARQYNSEGSMNGGPRITNTGAPLWVLGLKTEGPLNIINSLSTTTFAINEVLGGYFITGSGSSVTIPSTTCVGASATIGTSSATPAAFIMATGSTLEASFVEEVYGGAAALPTHSYPYYTVGAGGSYPCQPGSGNTTSPYPSIQRSPNSYEAGEDGFVITNIKAIP